MRVVKKTVSRFFVNGKGYANRTNAYRSIAKDELKAKAFKLACQICESETGKSIYADYFGALVPEEGPDRYMTFIIKAYRQMFPNDTRSGRRNWIADRTKELMEADK